MARKRFTTEQIIHKLRSRGSQIAGQTPTCAHDPIQGTLRAPLGSRLQISRATQPDAVPENHTRTGRHHVALLS